MPIIAGTSGPSPLSSHPVDVLIRELIDTGRPVRPGEVDRIVERIATAPFDSRIIRVPTDLRGLAYQGHVLGTRENALRYHLISRVMDDQQWASGVTETDYVDDLRRIVRSPDARIVLFFRRGGNIAGVIAPSDRGVSVDHRGVQYEPECFVVHSADRGIMTHGSRKR